MKINCNAYKGTNFYSLYLKLDQDIPSFEFLQKVKKILGDLDIHEPYNGRISYNSTPENLGYDPVLVGNIVIRLTEEELVRLRLMHDLIIHERSASFDLN